jgi:hypothetical protein
MIASILIAAACLPGVTTDNWIGSSMVTFISKRGACIEWLCTPNPYEVGVTKSRRITYCGLPTELPKVGSRVQTIMNAADPLKSLQNAGSRFQILPLNDPRFDPLIEEFTAWKLYQGEQ